MRPTIIGTVLAAALLVGCEGNFPAGGPQYETAKRAYDPERLTRSLREIEAWHIEHKTTVAESLRQGIPVRSIEAAFAGEGCTPTDELKALWSWRNGARSAVPFIWYHDFLSVEEAKSEYRALRWNPFVRWDPNYVPVFAFEGEWYASYCGPQGKASGPVVFFSLEDEPRVTYINLTTFLSTMAEAMRSGAVSWENGAMADDIREVYRIHQRHNRGYAFPYHVPKGP